MSLRGFYCRQCSHWWMSVEASTCPACEADDVAVTSGS